MQYWHGDFEGAMVRTRDRMYARYGDATEFLYDMNADPQQLCNRADDPAHAQVKQRMRVLLEKRLRDAQGRRLPEKGFF
jgi:arylsulfatase A-like enzyme